jgi:dipeptidyl aminopeptidase/acylaminoacyl peptidase
MSKTRLTVAVGVLAVVVLALAAFPGAQSDDIKADYARAFALPALVRNKIYDVVQSPTWVTGSEKFWYRKSVKGGDEFVLVDPTGPTKAPAFDHTRLAAALSAAAGASYTAITLPFSSFTYADGMQAIEFTIGGNGRGGGRGGRGRGGFGAAPGIPAPPRWRCTVTDYTCTRLAAETTPASAGRGRVGGGGGPQPAGEADVRVSPDGRTEAFIENFNLYIRPVAAGHGRSSGAQGSGRGGVTAAATPLSFDGTEGNAYSFSSIQWSPDSTSIAVYRVRPGYHRMVNYVQSSPPDQLQPKFSSRYYQKPGDVVDLDQPVLFHVQTRQEIDVDNTLFPNPYSNGRIEWWKDSRGVTFEYNQRGHQVYRVIDVDAATGTARVLIDETSPTFVDYRRATPGLTDSGRTYRYDVDDGKEIIWMSERDGWSHLYLCDGTTGQVKNQITKGNWAVHDVERVDEKNRQIYFTANGMDAGQDPYFLQYFRINFDGTGLVRYTTADAMHHVDWSPDGQYYVDTYSRVDLPPVSELHRTSDRSLVMTLEKADDMDLLATGWKPPEVFVAKGRDATTDIWGVIVRPTTFDPAKKYPVIENIYAGPQGSFVPKTFSTQTGMQTLAELGFIVVQIDGMGTANRSKAFHNVAWKNLGDAGFPDRILWHKAVAAKYPYYDISRVGIYGTSAGGQNAAGAVIFHPEFYKAAASSAGCHDNRMDKIWWNEQWMGWPVGPQYIASSNMENASKLGGALFLLVGEMDTNVDPSSTMQVVNKLIQAGKDFDLLVIPNADHTNGGAYGDHKRFDFFVRHLRGIEPPAWDTLTPTSTQGVGGVSVLDADAMPWVEAEDWGASQ